MPEAHRRPPCPREVTGRGRKFWAQVTGRYVDFRADELEHLRQACMTIARLERLESALANEPLLVDAAGGQQRTNPLLVEIRQQQAELRGSLRGLGLPDEPATVAARTPRSRAASHAARARWRSDATSS